MARDACSEHDRNAARLDPEHYLADADGELRRCAAQHWWAEGVDASGDRMPCVLSWEAVRDTLTDRRLSPRSFAEDMVASGLSPETARQVAPLFSLHGDEHRQMRATLSSAFTPRRVERLRPAAEGVAGRLADGIVRAEGSCEFVSAFAAPLPPAVFAILFGLPTGDGARMARWATVIARAFAASMSRDDVAAVESAAAEMRSYGLARISAVRAAPGDDLVSRLVEAEIDGHELDDDQIVAMITGFVFAGAETTRRQLTAAIQLFAEHPDAWRRVAGDPELLPLAVDEVLRHRPIVPGLTRRAEEPFAREDLELEEGGRLLVSFTTANHDPERFDDPDAFRVDRDDAHAHLTFGWGPHVCVGAGLARLEMAEALRALMTRFGPPTIDRTGPSTGLTAPDRLWVTFPSSDANASAAP